MGWDGVGWDRGEAGCDRMAQAETRFNKMSWMGWDGVGMDGTVGEGVAG